MIELVQHGQYLTRMREQFNKTWQWIKKFTAMGKIINSWPWYILYLLSTCHVQVFVRFSSNFCSVTTVVELKEKTVYNKTVCANDCCSAPCGNTETATHSLSIIQQKQTSSPSIMHTGKVSYNVYPICCLQTRKSEMTEIQDGSYPD